MMMLCAIPLGTADCFDHCTRGSTFQSILLSFRSIVQRFWSRLVAVLQDASRCSNILYHSLTFLEQWAGALRGFHDPSKDSKMIIVRFLWIFGMLSRFCVLEHGKKINVWIPGPFEGFQDDYCGILTGPEYFFGDSLNSQKILF